MNRRIAIHILTIWCTLGVFVVGCQPDNATPAVVLDSRLEAIYARFRAEAEKRGVTVDLSQLSGQITDIAEANVQGRCEHSATQGNRILIDEAFWNDASSLAQEYVVFHELGHCVLDRRHLDEAKNDGTCVSMMQSGSGSCRMIYTNQTRTSYLDELFLP